MNGPVMRSGFLLPPPRWVLQPVTAAVVVAVHVYLAFDHLMQLFGDVQWTHIWKGFGGLGGAYVLAALASRGLARTLDFPSASQETECRSAEPEWKIEPWKQHANVIVIALLAAVARVEET